MKKSFMKGAAAAMVLAAVAGSAWAQAGKRMRITVANYQVEPVPADAEMLKYYGDKYGVDFEFINIANEKYHEILNLKLAAGEIPDMFYLKQADTLGNYVRQGVCAKLDMGLLRKNAPDLVKCLDSYAPGYMNMGRMNGAQYAIPAVNPTNAFHIPLLYRGDWMKKVGVTRTPATLAEFEDLMYKFARNDPDGNGKNDTYGLSQDGLNAVFGAFGLVPYDHNSKGAAGTDYWGLVKGSVVNDSINPDLKQALALLAKWYKDGVIDPEFVTGENQGGYWPISHAFVKGRIGFTARGNYYHWAVAGAYTNIDANGQKVPSDANQVAKEFVTAQPNGELVFGQALKGPTGKQGIKKYNPLMNFFCVSKKVEKDPAKMAKIFEILNESANPVFEKRFTNQYGFKDKYWKLLDADTETTLFIPPYDTDAGYSYRIGAVLWITMPFPPKAPRERWAYSLGYDKLGIDNLIQVGLPMEQKYKVDLMKLRDETYISIITGAKPVSYFDDYVKQYLAMGGQAAQDEANAYYKEMTAK